MGAQDFSNESVSQYLDQAICLFRYIDDVFIIWTGTVTSLEKFIQLNINSFNPKFTFEWHKNNVSFLALMIYRDVSNNLAAKLYRKSTAGNTLLHAGSRQPTSLVHSIPYAQYIHLRRNCMHKAQFKIQAVELRTRLQECGYSKSLLRKACNKALNRERTSLLYSKTKSNQQTTKFITKYSAQHQQLCMCMAKHWHLLSEDPTLHQYVRNTPEIVFRKSPSIGDKLTASHYRPTVTVV